MPEIGLTRERIRDHFRRMWLVYLAGIALMCFLNNVVYDITRPAYSDDETLKIMYLNTLPSVRADALLADARALGFEAVEELEIAVLEGDPNSEMLLFVQLTGGFADICISDEAGLKLLRQRDACLALDGVALPGFEPCVGETGFTEALKTPSGEYLLVLKNGTNTQTALAALALLAENME